MPEGAIYVGRPSIWGNPYKVGDWDLGRSGRGEAVVAYRYWIANKLRDRPDWLAPLIGHDLVCWCPLDQPCHADVLLERTAA